MSYPSRLVSSLGRDDKFSSSPRKRGPRDAMGRAARTRHHRRWKQLTGCPMQQPNDLSSSLAALDQDSTLIAVIEMSRSTWLVASIVPGINRQPLKKLAADETALLQLLDRWRDEATKTGRTIGSDRGGLRSRPGRLLADAVAAGTRHRGLCDPPDKCCRIARASPGEDGSARYRVAQASLSRLAARRAAPLQHGKDPDA